MSWPERVVVSGGLGHLGREEFAVLLDRVPSSPDYRRVKRQARREFVERWPDLEAWRTAPLADRLLHPAGGSHRRSIAAGQRFYVCALAMEGRVELDYPWLLAHAFKDLSGINGSALGFGPAWISEAGQEAERIGYRQPGGYNAILKACLWVALHKADPDWRNITATDLRHLREAIIAFRDRPDVTQLRPGFAAGTDVKTWYRSARSYVYVAHVILHSLGIIPEQASRISLGTSPHTLPKSSTEMEDLFDRYLARAAPNRTRNRNNLRGRLRTFTTWLATTHPEITSFTQLTRPHIEEFLAWLSTDYKHYRTGAPVSLETRRQTISVLNVFFRNVLAWEWGGVPDRPLLSHLDMPKKVAHVPRYLPADQLAQIVKGIHALTDPYQRAANLIARWVGPRRSEIPRLELDCLDTYPDGHPRLRIPAGKTYTERSVPLHPEAADALGKCIALTRAARHRPLTDEVTGKPTRYVFQTRGRLMSSYRLFDTALQQACEHAGLVDETGARIVTSHRFRHTVGTQLAEEGARLQTIMAILGHRSSAMSLIYAQITDPTVLKDYKSALHPGAHIAGPAAEAIRNNQLPQATLDWLASNYYKTALELGHCLRLPEEGPCECDLFLTCSKFLTTTDYTPRLRDRLRLEQQLTQDATDRGWPREAERHAATARRIDELLDQLNEHREHQDPPTNRHKHER